VEGDPRGRARKGLPRPARRLLPLVHLWIALALVLGSPGGAAPRPAAAQSGEPVRYAYDALGRLVAVADPTGNSATYRYDAVGNLLGIGN